MLYYILFEYPFLAAIGILIAWLNHGIDAKIETDIKKSMTDKELYKQYKESILKEHIVLNLKITENELNDAASAQVIKFREENGYEDEGAKR